MRFHPTSEQIAIQDALRGTLAEAMPTERLHAHVNGTAAFDAASWDALMALGLGGLSMSEQSGGAGLGVVDLAMAMETLGENAAVGPIIQHLLATLALDMSAEAPVKEKWLAQAVAGSAVATVALGGDWLPQSWDVTLRNGRLHGRVAFVPGAASAQFMAVGIAGGGLAIAAMDPTISIDPVRSSDRTRRLSSVHFNGTPATALLLSSEQAARWFDIALVLVAADALGGAQYCLDLSVAYAKQREQFGGAIGRFQALKHQLATMALEVEPARALMWYAAYAIDSGLPDASRAAALAKAHICDRFVSVARAAVAAHGGIGYTWEYGLNIWFRRSLYDRAYLASPAVHRARAADLAGW